MKRSIQLNAQRRFEVALGLISQVLNAPLDPGSESGGPGVITQINASLITQTSFSEALTTYATGWRDDGVIDRELAFFAPRVESGRRLEYAKNINWQAYLSDTEEDKRAIGGEFKTVHYETTKQLDETENRGLQIIVDLDKERDNPNWEQQAVAKLMRRLKYNKFRRALGLLTAADTNTAKTWDTSAGKDPDQDVITELVTAANIIGMKPNRVAYGDTAWSKRGLAHRAQTSAGGFASAAMDERQLAGILRVSGVLASDSRYSATTTTKTEILGNLVMMFTGQEFADLEDPSNVKDFWTPTEQGGQWGVHSVPWGIKRHIVAVEHYEALRLVSNLGIRSFTVS